MKHIYEYEAPCGERIDETCEKIVSFYQEHHTRFNKVSTTFNGIKLIATEGVTKEALMQDFKRKMKASRKAYKRSAAYKMAQRKTKEETKRLHQEVVSLRKQFTHMDKTNIQTVLEWLVQIQPYTDYSPLKLNLTKEMRVLKAYGYFANENIEENFDGTNRNNFARYIIGQAIAQLETHQAIHPVINRFYNDWQQQFCA